MSIQTTTTHSFGIDSKINDPICGIRPLARAFCYPKSDWFSLTLGRHKDDIHLTWEEWDQLSEKVKELRATSRMEVILSAQGTPVKEGEL